MNSGAPTPVNVPSRNRTAVLVILGLFFGGMFVAGALRFSGWRPEGSKNNGELLQPYGDLRGHDLSLADGRTYRWHDEPRIWRIAVRPADCDGGRRPSCARLLADLDKVWRLTGRQADRVHLLWVGALPGDASGLREVRHVRDDDRLRAALADTRAGPAGDAAWIIDPNGFVVLRYAPGFDPGDLRTDLARLLRIN